MGAPREALRSLLRTLGLEVRRTRVAREAPPPLLEVDRRRAPLVRSLLAPSQAAVAEARSKDGQDLVAIWLTGGRPGYFVDLGAQDGVRKSNTWLLERRFGWSGICVDANPVVHEALRANRSAAIDVRALHATSRETRRFATILVPGMGGQSGLAEHRPGGGELPVEESDVETVSLGDLLDQHGAPARIDYLSLDIEGAELDALSGLADLTRRFSFLTCEHNFRPERERLLALLEGAGYGLVLQPFSRNEFWAVDRTGPFAASFGPDGLPVVPTG